MIIASCNNSKDNKNESRHIEKLAENFMNTVVIPKMKEPKPYQVVSLKVVIKTVGDNIRDYQFVYDNLSFNQYDSMENKRHLDSIVKTSRNRDSVISITVNVSCKTRCQFGNDVTDSIKLGYNSKDDKFFYGHFKYKTG